MTIFEMIDKSQKKIVGIPTKLLISQLLKGVKKVCSAFDHKISNH